MIISPYCCCGSRGGCSSHLLLSYISYIWLVVITHPKNICQLQQSSQRLRETTNVQTLTHQLAPNSQQPKLEKSSAKHSGSNTKHVKPISVGVRAQKGLTAPAAGYEYLGASGLSGCFNRNTAVICGVRNDMWRWLRHGDSSSTKMVVSRTLSSFLGRKISTNVLVASYCHNLISTWLTLEVFGLIQLATALQSVENSRCVELIACPPPNNHQLSTNQPYLG